jgi:hypothetical protein
MEFVLSWLRQAIFCNVLSPHQYSAYVDEQGLWFITITIFFLAELFVFAHHPACSSHFFCRTRILNLGDVMKIRMRPWCLCNFTALCSHIIFLYALRVIHQHHFSYVLIILLPRVTQENKFSHFPQRRHPTLHRTTTHTHTRPSLIGS